MQDELDKNLKLRLELGSKIQKLREQKNISLNQLANAFGLTKGTLSKIENGNINCGFTNLWKIAEALGMKLSDLIKLLEDELDEDFTLIDE